MCSVFSRKIPLGPRVIANCTRAFRTTALTLFIKTGSRDDSADAMGISHFIEHLLFRGSKNYTAKEIVHFAEGQGGSINAFTSEEFTCLHMQVLPKYCYQALEMLIDMIAHPQLRDVDIEKERQILLDEANSTIDQPSQLLSDEFSKALWGRHPLGQCIGGSMHSLRAITPDQIHAHYRQMYHPEALTISCTGDIDFEEMCVQVQQKTKNWRVDQSFPLRGYEEDGGGACDRYRKKPLEQVHFQIGAQLYPQSDIERCTWSLLNVVLGENMASRLFQGVRETRGLAYLIASECTHFTDRSALSIYAGAGEHLSRDCLATTLCILASLRRTQVTEREIDHAKSYLLGSLYQELDNPLGSALWQGEQYYSGWAVHPMTPEAFADLIHSVQLSHVQSGVEHLLTSAKWHGAFLGPNCGAQGAFRDWRALGKISTLSLRG